MQLLNAGPSGMLRARPALRRALTSCQPQMRPRRPQPLAIHQSPPLPSWAALRRALRPSLCSPWPRRQASRRAWRIRCGEMLSRLGRKRPTQGGERPTISLSTLSNPAALHHRCCPTSWPPWLQTKTKRTHWLVRRWLQAPLPPPLPRARLLPRRQRGGATSTGRSRRSRVS